MLQPRTRRVPKAALLLLACIAAIGAGKSSPPSGVRHGTWAQFEITLDDKRLVTNYRTDVSAELRSGKVTLVTVSLHYLDTLTDGQPSGIERVKQSNFESFLVPALEDDGKNILVADATVDQQHDWFFYSANPADAQWTARNAAQDHAPGYEIEVMTQPDPGGDFYARVVARAKRKEK